jgi:hypothetical protein
MTGDEPVAVSRDQPPGQEHALVQRLERPPAEVGPRPVGELVEEVEQQHGIAGFETHAA